MAKAYLVAVYYKIHDEEKLKNYGADALPAMMANGGTALARGTNISEIEGVPPERAVVVEFESVEAAQQAYNSEAYQAAKKKLEGGVDRMLFVIEGSLISKFRKSHLRFNLEHRNFPLREKSISVFRPR